MTDYDKLNPDKIKDYEMSEEERDHIAEDDATYQSFCEDGKYGFKKDDIVVVPPKYVDARNFREGLASVNLDGKWGYIDKSGTEVIPPIYDNAWDFCEVIALVKL